MYSMGEPSEIAENKIFILYLIKKMEMPIGSIQLVKIILENRFMNYFFFQQYLSDLLEEGLLTARNGQGGQYYEITEKGLRVLDMFESILPAGLKKRLEESIRSIRKNVRLETFITADYVPEGENAYSVICKIRENDFSLLEVKVAAGSREEARNICKNFTHFPQQIYSEILDTLMKDRSNDSGKG
jgi:predicted transcriptional regulator